MLEKVPECNKGEGVQKLETALESKVSDIG